jgi:hypothetical protein
MHRINVTNRTSIPKIVIDRPWTQTKEDVASLYGVDEEIGLSEESVRRDFERYGPNGNINTSMFYFNHFFM